MSFTSEIKAQICKEEVDRNQARAQLCALFQMRASLHMNVSGMYLSYQTENANIAKHVFQLMKMVYDVNPRLSVVKNMRLKRIIFIAFKSLKKPMKFYQTWVLLQKRAYTISL